MKFFNIIPLITLISFVLSSDVFPTDFEFDLEDRSEIGEDFYHDFLDLDNLIFSKRADSSNASLDAIEAILIQTDQSGIVWKLLDSIAASNASMDNIANLLISVLSGNSSALSGLGIDVNINTTTILNEVMASGLITSVANGLLLNDTNRVTVATFAGNLLANNVWVSKLLQATGNGVDLTPKFIADTIQNSKSKNPNYQGNQGKQATFQFDKRANDTAGSAQQFLSNLANSVLQSNLVGGSFEEILIALNDTGVALDFVLQSFNHTDTLYTIGSTVLSKVYNAGVLDDIDLVTPFNNLKKEHTLANGLEAVLTSDTYATPVAKIFQQMEDSGVFMAIKLNLWGP